MFTEGSFAMSTMKEFKDQQGATLAYAAIPDQYMTGASLVNKMQHEGVPFFITAHAIDASRNIMIFGLSDEMFTTYKNQMIKMTLKAVPNVIWSSIRDFIEPEVYLQQFAESLSQMKLTPTAMTDLPSLIGQNLQNYYNTMMADYQGAFDREAALGTPTFANNSICRSFLVRYTGKAKSGADCVVLGGMDYKGVEYYSSVSIASVLGPLAGMLGGAAKAKQKEKSSKQFGHGTPCDAVDWGSANKFLLMTPAEYEAEATKDFLEFVQIFHMEEGLRDQFYQRILQRRQENLMQTLQLQQMAQQSAQNLMMNQQRLVQTLQQNSAAMHAGIMDSWNKKMASDARISQARSEATMGVNVYTNTYGQNVDVSVTADHVYQNQYGDVYGVSGNAVDDEVLTQLNWTELKK